MVKSIDYHIRSDRPDGSYYIFFNIFIVPYFNGFFRIFRITKIVCPRKSLISTIYPPRRKQFLGSDNTEQFTDLWSNKILTSVSSCKRKVICIGVDTIGKVRNETSILI